MGESQENQVVRVPFHALAAGGEAVGRDENGKTVFAPFGAPGDTAFVALEQEKPSFSRGFISHLETLSPHRVVPPCPQFRPENPLHSCGGCNWQHVALETQRTNKRDIVQAALSRLGGQNIEVEPCRGGMGYVYRNKADFVIGRGESGAQIGFFAPGSHDLVDASVCPIQSPQNEAVLKAAREILARYPEWAFDATTGQGAWRRLVARTATNGETLLTLVTAGDSWSESEAVAASFRAAIPSLAGVLLRGPKSAAKVVWGRDFLIERAGSLDFRVSGEAFWQVNPEMAPQLAQMALEMAPVKRGERALDLFCGAGFFALHLSRAGADVVGIETHRGAIRDAMYNAQANGLKAQFIVGDAAKSLKKFRSGDFELILLDPPRAGAAFCLPRLLEIAPRRLIYVSCDPATLARDARKLSAGGYVLRRAVPFDLFPQTAHVEVVTLFERSF